MDSSGPPTYGELWMSKAWPRHVQSSGRLSGLESVLDSRQKSVTSLPTFSDSESETLAFLFSS